jgi:hypothetical protein
MAMVIERPQFQEGQMLGAQDLEALLDYNRARQARHARCAHIWGIVCGLELIIEEGKAIVTPGIAIDSSGAEIVVAEKITLNEEDFVGDVVLSKEDEKDDPDFAVFITRTNKEMVADQSLGRCQNVSGTRFLEHYQFRFRRNALNWDEGRSDVDVGADPDDSEESTLVVLLGFLKWDFDKWIANPQDKEFKSASLESGRIRPHFAGIRAEEMVGTAGRLVLRTDPPIVDGVPTKDAPTIVVDKNKESHTFAFGVDNGQGDFDPKFSVDLKGNVFASGSLNIPINVSKVFVQSGTATDGSKLVLPTGISEEQLGDSNVVLHVHLTPRLNLSVRPSAAGSWFPMGQHRCEIDEDRRVTCLIEWVDAAAPANIEPLPGVFDYLLMVSVPASKEGSTT